VPTTTCIGTPGALCTDGTYYVGYYDGRHIYTTPNDEAGTYTWGPNNLICTTSGTNGNTNQATLEALGIASYPAAQACKALNALSYKGHTDWYLPARGEGALLTAQMSTLGLLGTYFTSTESSAINVFQVTTNYPGSTFDNATKWSAYKIHCTRDD